MIDNQPSPEKSGKLSLKSVLLGIFILLILIATAVTLKILYFTHNASTVPNKPNPSTNSLNIKRSESLDQLSPSITSTGPIKVVYSLPVKQPVVYITIDDGWYPNEEVLRLMQQYHLPITTFLIEQAAQERPDFWHKFVNAGGHIEDHTLNHPFLTHISLAEQKNQISQPKDYFRQYGPPPDELRPPYGDFNSAVGQAAWDSGMKYIVMWDAEMKNSTLYTRNNQGLKPGDIILLHWIPGLGQELVLLLNIILKQNLGIADLTQALNGEPLTISWIKSPIPVPKSIPPLTTGTTGSKSSANPGTTSASGSTGTLGNTVNSATTVNSGAGTSAATGTSGANGTSGSTGSSGTTTGTSGSTGTSGATGTSWSTTGTPGTTGTSGSTTGTPGATGSYGSTTGTPGTTGTSGSTGTHS